MSEASKIDLDKAKGLLQATLLTSSIDDGAALRSV